MEPNELDQLLKKVHDAIRNARRVDKKGRVILEDLELDIRELLERSGRDRGDQSVKRKLNEAIDHFEMTHPTLTALLSELSTILSNAGI